MSKQAVLPPTPSATPPLASPAVPLTNPLHLPPFHGKSPKTASTDISHVPSHFRDGDGTASDAGDTERTPIAQRTRRHSLSDFTPLTVSSLVLDSPPSTTLLPSHEFATSPQATSPIDPTGITETASENQRGAEPTGSSGKSGEVRGESIVLGNQVEDYVASRKVNPGGGECDDGFRFGVVKFFNSQKGFGFIVDENPDQLGDDEVFVHYSSIAAVQPGNGTFRSLSEGEEVRYSIVRGEKGYSAQKVTARNGGPCFGSTYVNSTLVNSTQAYSPPKVERSNPLEGPPLTIAARRGPSFQRDRKTNHFSTVRLSNAYGDASYPSVDHERGSYQGIHPQQFQSYSMMGYQDYPGAMYSPYGGPGPIYWSGGAVGDVGYVETAAAPSIYSPASSIPLQYPPYFPMQQPPTFVPSPPSRPPLQHRRHPSSGSTIPAELSPVSTVESPTTSTDSKDSAIVDSERIEGTTLESSVAVAPSTVAEEQSVPKLEDNYTIKIPQLDAGAVNQLVDPGSNSPGYFPPPTPGGYGYRYWSQRSSPGFSMVPLATPSFPGFYQNAQNFPHGDDGSLPLSQLYSPTFPVPPNYPPNNYVHPGYSPTVSMDRSGSRLSETRRSSVNYFGQVHT